MEQGTPERFASKVDWWLAIVIAGVPLTSLVVVVAGLAGGDTGAAAGGAVTIALIVALYVGVVWPVSYEVDAQALVVRFGLVRSRVPLAEITKVAPSRNPLASPALSLDRIRLDRRGGSFVLVSPANRTGFADAIKRGAEIDERLRSA